MATSNRIIAENIGRIKAAYIPPRKKYVDIIIYQSLSIKKIIKRGKIALPYHTGNYDYSIELQQLFQPVARVFITREKLKHGKLYIYHIYLSIN